MVDRDSAHTIESEDNSVAVNQKIKQLKNLSNQIRVEYRGWESGRHIDENQLKRLPYYSKELKENLEILYHQITKIFQGRSNY